MVIFYSLIGTVSVIGNFVVLFVVYKSKQLRHSQYIYKCSIAVSDIIWGFSISAYFIKYCLIILNLSPVNVDYRKIYFRNPVVEVINKNGIKYYNYILDNEILPLNISNDKLFDTILLFTLEYVTPTTLYVSFISLLFSSVDRYIALTFPFRYKQVNSFKIAKLVSVFIWLFSTVIHTVPAFLAFKESDIPPIFFQPINYNSIKKSLSHHLTAAILLSLLSLLWLLTFMTLFSLYKNYKTSLALGRKAKKRFSSEKQMSLVLICMVVAFTFSLASTTYHLFYSYLYYEQCVEKLIFISTALLSTN